ncbi:MAG: helix-turn-helix domain-containing protein [Clostridia bacterium]|nr:helix-turn-helix domain-containing protein [Clostridia bacterium]
MAARLTDFQKKKIIADYVELGSYNAVAKINGVADTTVKRIVNADAEMQRNAEQKKEENTADILAHMEKKKDKVIEIIDTYLNELLSPVIISRANPSQLTTALGTLIDKFTAIQSASGSDAQEDDPLTASLMEEAERLNNGDQ